MTLFDEIFPDLVSALMPDFGVECTLVVQNGEYDFDTGTEFPNPESSSVYAIFPELTKHQIDSLGLEAGEMVAFVEGTAVTKAVVPKKATLQYDNKQYIVNRVDSYRSGTEVPLIALVLKMSG